MAYLIPYMGRLLLVWFIKRAWAACGFFKSFSQLFPVSPPPPECPLHEDNKIQTMFTDFNFFREFYLYNSVKRDMKELWAFQ